MQENATGGIQVKFRYNMMKIMSAAALAVLLGLWSLPCGVLAASPEETENSVESNYQNVGEVIRENGEEEKYNESTGEETEYIEEPKNLEETEREPEGGESPENGGENSAGPEDGEKTPEEVPFYMKDPVTGIIVEADAGVVPSGAIAVIVPVEGREEAEQLGQFLSLSAERYTAYYITLIDYMTMSPVVPAGDLKISIPVPESYDQSRVVVSSIVLQAETPQRTELAADLTDGRAVFVSGQSGLFAVMEKKELPELPSELEMTSKVDELHLTSGYQNMNLTSTYTSSSSLITASPATGDEANAVTWAVAAVVAVGVAAVVVIIIIRNRKR